MQGQGKGVAKPAETFYLDPHSRLGRMQLQLERGRSSGVEHNLAKVGVEGSNPFARSSFLENFTALCFSSRRFGWLAARLCGWARAPWNARRFMRGVNEAALWRNREGRHRE
jgi:hypothetical protein